LKLVHVTGRCRERFKRVTYGDERSWWDDYWTITHVCLSNYHYTSSISITYLSSREIDAYNQCNQVMLLTSYCWSQNIPYELRSLNWRCVWVCVTLPYWEKQLHGEDGTKGWWQVCFLSSTIRQ
jgi:hypothetical protein